MGRRVDRKKLAEWQRRLGRYERTNLTAAEFCKRERVSVALLKYWRRQVELAALRSPAPMRPSPQAAVFAPVELIPRRWIVSFRQACMERRGGPASVTEFIGMQARSSHGWTGAARGGCGVVESR